jgi:predicted amidohydrolase
MAAGRPGLESVAPWWPYPETKPKLSKGKDKGLRIAANGTRTCSGGWELTYTGVRPGATYEVAVGVAYEGLAHPREMLGAVAMWRQADGSFPHTDQLLPIEEGVGRRRLLRVMTVPPGAEAMVVRCFLRWTPLGSTVWSAPTVRVVPRPELKPARVCVVTGSLPRIDASRPRRVEDNVAFYEDLCAQACETVKPDLIALPEIALQWRLTGSPYERAVAIPSAATDAFAALARKYRTHLVLGLHERDGEAVFNTAALFDRRGRLAGRYHKVHLASGSEWFSGVLPGDEFPVFQTDLGGIGCNICMDSSAAESSRMVGLNGGEFLVLPIMGDHRADRTSPGQPIYHDARWRAIMQVRAMDNQLTMVVARNHGQGSCIVSRRGEFLAYNDGDQDFVWAEVPRRDPHRLWCGDCLRDVNWVQRRPRVYAPFVEESNYGTLSALQTTGED